MTGLKKPTQGSKLTVADYASHLVAGGFPELFSLDPADAQEAMESYLLEMSEHDYPDLVGPRRDPRLFRNFLLGYAGLIAQPATAAAIRRRMGELSGAHTPPSPETVNVLHDFATRLFLVEDQPAWSPSVRSKTTLVQMPKRHLADPGLAAALLAVSPDYLLRDLEMLGIFFESLVVHDLRVYAQALRSRGVFHLRDTKAREEIDAVVELHDGRWLGFEVKLSHHAIDGAAAHLKAAAAKVVPEAAALLVIVPTGPAFRRANGVWVVPLAALVP
ncbi:MAG: ATP-binding protein [Corynebacterium pyruviciproducens]|uniref:ATP-binding protein n=1 Tax=Corynebacterium pyruviciproducens TaxID=598660 RepID=UPI003982EAD9